jgi:DNA-binding transcriptional ArsR family regulator
VFRAWVRVADTGVSSDKQATTGDKQAINIDDRERAIVALLHERTTVRSTEIAELLGLSISRTRYVIKPLVEHGLIEKCGDRKSAYYRLKDE